MLMYYCPRVTRHLNGRNVQQDRTLTVNISGDTTECLKGKGLRNVYKGFNVSALKEDSPALVAVLAGQGIFDTS